MDSLANCCKTTSVKAIIYRPTSVISQVDVYYRLYKIRYELWNFMLLFVLICRYLMALRVFESFNLLSYGFAFNYRRFEC